MNAWEMQAANTLGRDGFVHVRGPFASLDDAWRAAGEIVSAHGPDGEPLEVLGDFVIPPPDAPPSRDFQTLHFDFGLPLVPETDGDVARFTALHVRSDRPPGDAVTRLVPLEALLAARAWPDRGELVRRFAAYGASHGAWAGADGYVEGSLARIVEAALGEAPALPSVKAEPEFLCGTEFASADEERRFLRDRGLDPEAVAFEVSLGPGELLVFDNLAVAHGRRGQRRPEELDQRVFGHRAATVERQVALRDRVLARFGQAQPRRLPRYRLITGADDAAFCHRVSAAMALGYELYGPPCLAVAEGGATVAGQALLWPEDGGEPPLADA